MFAVCVLTRRRPLFPVRGTARQADIFGAASAGDTG
jgi:hypothetical protein